MARKFTLTVEQIDQAGVPVWAVQSADAVPNGRMLVGGATMMDALARVPGAIADLEAATATTAGQWRTVEILKTDVVPMVWEKAAFEAVRQGDVFRCFSPDGRQITGPLLADADPVPCDAPSGNFDIKATQLQGDEVNGFRAVGDTTSITGLPRHHRLHVATGIFATKTPPLG